MKPAFLRLLLLCSLFTVTYSSLHAQAPATCTVSDTIYTSAGALATGTATIIVPAFKSPDNKTVRADVRTVTYTNGVFSAALVPTVGATPSGVSYTVRFGSDEQYWAVPASGCPKTIPEVRVERAPSPNVLLSASQVSGTAIVASPSANQTITAPATAGVIPLIVKGNSTANTKVLQVYDSASTPAEQAYFDSTAALFLNKALTTTGGRVATGRNRYCSVPVGFTAYASFGTSTTPVAGTIYYADVFVPRNMTITGVSVLNGGTVGTNKWIVGLHATAGGATVANSNLAGVTSSGANAFQDVPFTGTYAAVGPARYWIAFQTDGTTDRFRTVAASTFVDVLTKSAAGAFGTLASLTVPTTFTADVGPIGCLY